jgi:hypothetical protein
MPPGLWRDLMVAAADGRPAEGADIALQMDRRPPAAMLDFEAAKAFAADGRHADARARLDRAMAFWRTVRADHYLARAEAFEATLPADSAKTRAPAATAARRARRS